MNLLQALIKLRDDLRIWVTNNLNALNAKIDEKTIPIDTELDSTSTNPVQNKVVTNAINNIPKFSGDYNDLTNAPNITEDDSGNMIIADESGNIIFKADAKGIHTTALSLGGENAATEAYVDHAVANIDIPEVDFTGYATEKFVAQSIENVKTDISESITSEGEDWKIVDEDGNIILNVNAEGVHTTNLTLNGEKAATETYVDNAIENIDLTDYVTKEYVDDAIGNIQIPDVDFTGYATEEYVEKTVSNKATYSDLEELKVEMSESITSESEEWSIADNSGNIILSVDKEGVHTTSLTLNGEQIEDVIDTKVGNALSNKNKTWVFYCGTSTELVESL